MTLAQGITRVLLVPALWLAMAAALAADAGGVLRIGGAGAGLGTLRILGGEFEKAHPGAKVEIVPNLGSSGGIKALLAGAVDLAICARPLLPAEIQAGARPHPYGRTPFVFIANRDVAETDITTAGLARILEGKLSAWADGRRIRMVLRPVTDVDTAILLALSPEVGPAMKAAHDRPGMFIATTDQESLASVGRIPGALGTASLAQLATEPHGVKVLSHNGVAPGLQALAEGRYPLEKRMALVSGPRTPALAQAFLLFIRTARGRALLSSTGHLPEEGAP